MSYYAKRQLIAKVDKKGNIIGEIEKWEAHKKGILHRAFTVCLRYEDKFVLQHRKHPSFDGAFDLTSSSHQIFISEHHGQTEESLTDVTKNKSSIPPSKNPQNQSNIFINGMMLQGTINAIYQTLQREWDLSENDLKSDPRFEREIYYKAHDSSSLFIEHEICEIWSVEIPKLPVPNFEYAYGYSLATQEELKHPQIWQNLAPWVKKYLQ